MPVPCFEILQQAMRSCVQWDDRTHIYSQGFIYGGVTIGDMPVYRKKERRSWSKMKKKGFF